MAYPFYPTNYYPNQNFFPATYQPVVSYQPQMPNQQTQQNQVVASGILWVDDERDAAMYPIAPNNAVALWEKSGKRAYMKQADATGKPTMTIYDLVEKKESDVGSSDSGKKEYATKDEISILADAVKEFADVISGLRADIETMKSDMYGIAGKKKVVKKNDADDE